jgi:hypothetical protein
MSGTKTELRLIAAVLLTAFTIATPLQGANAAPETYPTTVTFLADKFVNGKTLDGFTPGTPDYGFTLEAMLQLKAGGKKLTDQLTAIKTVLADTTVPSRSIISTYVYGVDKKIKPGMAGKFLFTSAALGVPNAPLRNSVVADLKKAIASNGVITGSVGNSFDYAWTVLGLATNNQNKLANSVAVQLAKLERPDGGFGMDQTGNTQASSADATGISIQALWLAKKTATTSQQAIERTALVGGAKYLRETQVAGDHWEAWGDVDVNGTAYAAMGLKAVGVSVTATQTWLKSRLAPTGGLTTPWSNGKGDVFATAQGYVPLMGKSYLDLIPVKK